MKFTYYNLQLVLVDLEARNDDEFQKLNWRDVYNNTRGAALDKVFEIHKNRLVSVGFVILHLK